MGAVLVFLELEKGKLSDSSKKIIGQGRFIADSVGGFLKGFCFEKNPAFNDAFKFGIDKLIIARADVEVLSNLFRKEECKLILCVDGVAENIFARVAQRLKIGFITRVSDVQYDATSDNFYFTFRAFSDKVKAQGTFEEPTFNIVSMDVSQISVPSEFFEKEICIEEL